MKGAGAELPEEVLEWVIHRAFWLAGCRNHPGEPPWYHKPRAEGSFSPSATPFTFSPAELAGLSRGLKLEVALLGNGAGVAYHRSCSGGEALDSSLGELG